MASNADFVQFIADQCSGAGEIVTKKMFGDYGIYCNGKIFGLICDDRFYLKPTEATSTLLRKKELLIRNKKEDSLKTRQRCSFDVVQSLCTASTERLYWQYRASVLSPHCF